MSTWLIIAVVGVLAVAAICAPVRILKQYERGVQFRLGRLKDGPRGICSTAGCAAIAPSASCAGPGSAAASASTPCGPAC